MTVEIRSATVPAAVPAERDAMQALLRGMRGRCPACNQGRMFTAYLKVAPACESCGEELHHQRADDAPPYFTMLIVGHIVIGLVLSVEQTFAPPVWVHTVLWGPLVIALSLLLLGRIKGALIGYQWALRMHGFGDRDPAQPEVFDNGGGR